MEKESEIMEGDRETKFTCCVCLDISYKPIVLVCGHMLCFWCVYISMNGIGKSSHCPHCRYSYRHFPAICEMLHYLIVKLYPVDHERRAIDILGEEEVNGIFSPKFDIGESSDASLNQINITDVLCPTCKQMLFRPAVLNCGHAYCEACITSPKDDGIIICSVCKIPHPSDLPKVLLEFDDFLEKTFPEAYAARRNSIEHQRGDLQQNPPLADPGIRRNDSFNSFNDWFKWINEEQDRSVHLSTCCDCCGVYPIIGTRYKCKECKEKVGFNLCEECCNIESKRVGRFNQQHSVEHTFEMLERTEFKREEMLKFFELARERYPVNPWNTFEGDGVEEEDGVDEEDVSDAEPFHWSEGSD